jgi:hypothetical protein
MYEEKSRGRFIKMSLKFILMDLLHFQLVQVIPVSAKHKISITSFNGYLSKMSNRVVEWFMFMS